MNRQVREERQEKTKGFLRVPGVLSGKRFN